MSPFLSFSLGKMNEAYIRVKQGKEEFFTDFLQRLTKAVQLGVPHPEARCELIKSLSLKWLTEKFI